MICSFSWWSFPSTHFIMWQLYFQNLPQAKTHIFPQSIVGFLLNTFRSLLSKAELAGETISRLLIHFTLDNFKIWVVFIASFSPSNKKVALCVCVFRLCMAKREEVCGYKQALPHHWLPSYQECGTPSFPNMMSRCPLGGRAENSIPQRWKFW